MNQTHYFCFIFIYYFKQIYWLDILENFNKKFIWAFFPNRNGKPILSFYCFLWIKIFLSRLLIKFLKKKYLLKLINSLIVYNVIRLQFFQSKFIQLLDLINLLNKDIFKVFIIPTINYFVSYWVTITKFHIIRFWVKFFNCLTKWKSFIFL